MSGGQAGSLNAGVIPVLAGLGLCLSGTAVRILTSGATAAYVAGLLVGVGIAILVAANRRAS